MHVKKSNTAKWIRNRLNCRKLCKTECIENYVNLFCCYLLSYCYIFFNYLMLFFFADTSNITIGCYVVEYSPRVPISITVGSNQLQGLEISICYLDVYFAASSSKKKSRHYANKYVRVWSHVFLWTVSLLCSNSKIRFDQCVCLVQIRAHIHHDC